MPVDENIPPPVELELGDLNPAPALEDAPSIPPPP